MAPLSQKTSAFWSGEKLLENSNLIEPFKESLIDCNAYRLRMGNRYYRTADNEEGVQQKKTKLAEGEAFIIPAGQFAYLLSKEIVTVPHDSMAFISMSTRIKFQGLINVSGFHVDPGYKGQLVFAVFNASPSPVQICENDDIFKIWYCGLDRKSDSPFVFKDHGIYDISNDMVKGMNKEILSLQSLSDKIRFQQPTIDHLYLFYRTTTIGAIGVIIAGLIATTWPFLEFAREYVRNHLPSVIETTTTDTAPVKPNANTSEPTE